MSYTVVKDFLTKQESESVLNYLNSIFTANPDGRGIKRFGLTNSYASNKISSDIPLVLQYLCDKLEGTGYAANIGHVTVNRYDVGQSIPYHIDNKEAGEVITVISLASDAVMLFKTPYGKEIRVELPERSLLQFGEDHRYKMKHSIEPVKKIRYSIVFRKH